MHALCLGVQSLRAPGDPVSCFCRFSCGVFWPLWPFQSFLPSSTRFPLLHLVFGFESLCLFHQLLRKATWMTVTLASFASIQITNVSRVGSLSWRGTQGGPVITWPAIPSLSAPSLFPVPLISRNTVVRRFVSGSVSPPLHWKSCLAIGRYQFVSHIPSCKEF